MKTQKKLRANTSGQLIIVAALVIAILISSTTIYVYELTMQNNSDTSSSFTNFVLALKQSTKNAMISSLANISNGGEEAVLEANLNELSQFLRRLNSFGIYQLTFTLLNDVNYDSGVWLSWNLSDEGVSSAYANFTLQVYGASENVTLNYAVNVTTAATINGVYTLAGDEKQVNLTCNVYNEGQPALARNIALFYNNSGSWTQIDASNNLSIMDYGNGTYSISFAVTTALDNVQISAHVTDFRSIFVQANTTCSEA